ncbi:MAG TPA: hypothetical protein VGN72_23920 [Tepidisphaeraceae bacterium]|jgi:protein required for attachment to host cells|nr:hypothetical protein [Tepidisphaeraceae bacterium]
MPHKATRAASYTRDLSVTTDKFAELDRLCRGTPRNKVDAIIVAAPQVLGDTYEELIQNLNKVAQADLALIIVPQRTTNLN